MSTDLSGNYVYEVDTVKRIVFQSKKVHYKDKVQLLSGVSGAEVVVVGQQKLSNASDVIVVATNRFDDEAIRNCVRKPVFATVLSLFFLVLGVIGLRN